MREWLFSSSLTFSDLFRLTVRLCTVCRDYMESFVLSVPRGARSRSFSMPDFARSAEWHVTE